MIIYLKMGKFRSKGRLSQNWTCVWNLSGIAEVARCSLAPSLHGTQDDTHVHVAKDKGQHPQTEESLNKRKPGQHGLGSNSRLEVIHQKCPVSYKCHRESTLSLSSSRRAAQMCRVPLDVLQFFTLKAALPDLNLWLEFGLSLLFPQTWILVCQSHKLRR